MKKQNESEYKHNLTVHSETSEVQYIEELMDGFNLEKSNTLGDLLKCLEDEEAGVYDDEGDDGNT